MFYLYDIILYYIDDLEILSKYGPGTDEFDLLLFFANLFVLLLSN